MTNIEKLKSQGNALEEIRQRLGAKTKSDSSFDSQINEMSPKEIASTWAAWHLGYDWGEIIIDLYEHMKKEK